METQIYKDDQYLIETNLGVSNLEHVCNIKEIAYGFFLKFLQENGISQEEALSQFEKLKAREGALQEEMLAEIKKL